jgi:excisionase family DNA binding protein
MKQNFEQEDLKLIAKDVAETLKPLLRSNKKSSDSNIVFDVKELAGYLKVNESWVYNQVHLKTIPYFKCGKYTRFKKSQIDKWIEKESIQPVPPFS